MDTNQLFEKYQTLGKRKYFFLIIYLKKENICMLIKYL